MSDRPPLQSRVVGLSGAALCAVRGEHIWCITGRCIVCDKPDRQPRRLNNRPPREGPPSPVIDPPDPLDAIDVAYGPGQTLP